MESYKHFRIETLADGVHAALGGVNAGIVDLGDQTLVFDTTVLLSAGRELSAAARHLTGRPAALVINSHMHPDHIHGNAAFDGATIIASEVTREVIAREGAVRMERMAKQMAARGFSDEFFAGYPTAADLRVPTLTFRQSLTFHGSRRTAHLITFGAAHSPCDAMLWLPAERLLFIGDLVIPGSNLILSSGGTPERWPGVLDQAEALGAERLVPGHGEVVPAAEGFGWAREFLSHMFSLADQAVAAGKTAAWAASVDVPAGYSEHWYRQDLAFLITRKLDEAAPTR